MFVHFHMIIAIFDYFMQMAESCIAKFGFQLICELLSGKEIHYVIPITSILGKMPTVSAGDTGTIP